MIERDHWSHAISAEIWSKPMKRYYAYEKFDVGENEDRCTWHFCSLPFFCRGVYRKVKDHCM
jgi:hypothetical protein